LREVTDDRLTATDTTSPPSNEGRVRVRRRFPRRHLRGPRTVEAYLKADSPPRYIRRLRQIEIEFERQRRRLEAAYRALAETWGHDPLAFSARWRARALGWRFDRLNDLIREHNEWYPVESNLAMDPRTRDYVPVHGRSYRRIELGPEWILEHFPPTPRSAARHRRTPIRLPREPS
jgi:hypothetical protein